ncbi:hypothetical protein GCM10011452_32290 [Gemmobacter lanyuensis]|uniref:Uncharacterized protein n=1 Tax=Gemmobacter lanyuensis TaxID=1054497 RepID=A0A918J0C1_9RHOB|nr:hypothetical protein GCM10011452_32290 [Gemmobacter lanyuensis]
MNGPASQKAGIQKGQARPDRPSRRTDPIRAVRKAAPQGPRLDPGRSFGYRMIRVPRTCRLQTKVTVKRGTVRHLTP